MPPSPQHKTSISIAAQAMAFRFAKIPYLYIIALEIAMLTKNAISKSPLTLILPSGRLHGLLKIKFMATKTAPTMHISVASRCNHALRAVINVKFKKQWHKNHTAKPKITGWLVMRAAIFFISLITALL